MNIKTQRLENCAACDSSNLRDIIDLPKFPHVGIYIRNTDESSKYPPIDNNLRYCKKCGHIQLGVTVDPDFLYTADFQHKTSQSASAKQANQFLYKFVEKVHEGISAPKIVVEIGCNDTFLLQQFVDKGAIAIGVDPILKDKEDIFLKNIAEKDKNKFRVIGSFVESVDFKSLLGETPDLFISNFVFEHIRNPFEVVKGILSKMSDDSIAVLGVPGSEFMVMNSRYDQLSHQHYQQFNLQSFQKMIVRAGGEIISHAINFTNWGQIIVAFKKSKKLINPDYYGNPYNDNYIDKSIKSFFDQIDLFKTRLELLSNKPIYGFGAAQNFPIFEYFCKQHLPFKIILDDHPLRQDNYFSGLDYKIKKPKIDYSGAVGVLTGPDYSRVLVSRMSDLKFDHIVIPFSAN